MAGYRNVPITYRRHDGEIAALAEHDIRQHGDLEQLRRFIHGLIHPQASDGTLPPVQGLEVPGVQGQPGPHHPVPGVGGGPGPVGGGPGFHIGWIYRAPNNLLLFHNIEGTPWEFFLNNVILIYAEVVEI